MAKWTIKTLKALVEQRFSASEKAIEKAETAQTEYNARSNEFRAALDDQAKTLLPRTEAEVRFEQMREQIAALQEANSRGQGASSAASAAKTNSQAVLYLVVLVTLQALAGLGTLIFYLFTRK